MDHHSIRTPNIDLRPQEGVFIITGRSYPQNAQETYHQMIMTLKEYMKNPQPQTRLDLHLEICNTSSMRVLVYIFETLEELIQNHGTTGEINWYVYGDNPDDYNLGVDMKKFTDLPFNIIKKTFEERPGK